MISFTFDKILKYNTFVISNDSEEEKVCFEFLGVNKPIVGDKILINEDLLDEKSSTYTQPYTFKRIDNVDPHKVKDLNNKDYIVISLNENIYVLKRIYG